MDPLGRARALIPPRAAPLTLRGGYPVALPFSIFRSIFHNPRLYLTLTYHFKRYKSGVLAGFPQPNTCAGILGYIYDFDGMIYP